MADVWNHESLRAAALAACFLALHIFFSAHHLRACMAWLIKPSSEDDPCGVRLEMALVEARKANFFKLARFGSFAGAGGVTYFIYAYIVNPCLGEASFAITTLIMYVQFTVVASQNLELTIDIAEFGCCSFYGLLLLCYLELPFIQEAHIDAKAYDTCCTAIRFILAAVALNTRLSFPWQLLITAGQVWSDFKSPAGMHHPGFSVFLQCVVLGLTILGSHTLETCVRSTIRAQFHGSDAESLMVSFRQLLRGVCDGEVLLDSNLRIHSVSDCLKHLLMSSTNMHGKSFQQLLDPADLQKFREFVETSASQTEQKSSTPSCLHVSLLGAASTRIPVYLYHVPIFKLYGSHDPYHLIALKEDSDQRAPPEQAVAFPHRHRVYTGSEGSASVTGLQALFGNLSEMSLLLDPATGCCDVHRAHLRFRHRPGHEINLRSIVLPTDWASIHEAVTQFSERQDAALTTSYAHRLPTIRCRMPDRCSRIYNSAHLVELSAHSRLNRKVWLRLGDLVEGTASGELRHLHRVLPELRRSRSQTSI